MNPPDGLMPGGAPAAAPGMLPAPLQAQAMQIFASQMVAWQQLHGFLPPPQVQAQLYGVAMASVAAAAQPQPQPQPEAFPADPSSNPSSRGSGAKQGSNSTGNLGGNYGRRAAAIDECSLAPPQLTGPATASEQPSVPLLPPVSDSPSPSVPEPGSESESDGDFGDLIASASAAVAVPVLSQAEDAGPPPSGPGGSLDSWEPRDRTEPLEVPSASELEALLLAGIGEPPAAGAVAPAIGGCPLPSRADILVDLESPSGEAIATAPASLPVQANRPLLDTIFDDLLEPAVARGTASIDPELFLGPASPPAAPVPAPPPSVGDQPQPVSLPDAGWELPRFVWLPSAAEVEEKGAPDFWMQPTQEAGPDPDNSLEELLRSLIRQNRLREAVACSRLLERRRELQRLGRLKQETTLQAAALAAQGDCPEAEEELLQRALDISQQIKQLRATQDQPDPGWSRSRDPSAPPEPPEPSQLRNFLHGIHPRLAAEFPRAEESRAPALTTPESPPTAKQLEQAVAQRQHLWACFQRRLLGLPPEGLSDWLRCSRQLLAQICAELQRLDRFCGDAAAVLGAKLPPGGRERLTKALAADPRLWRFVEGVAALRRVQLRLEASADQLCLAPHLGPWSEACQAAAASIQRRAAAAAWLGAILARAGWPPAARPALPSQPTKPGGPEPSPEQRLCALCRQPMPAADCYQSEQLCDRWDGFPGHTGCIGAWELVAHRPPGFDKPYCR